MEDSNEHRMLYSRIFRRGFKAGVEWDRAKTMEQPEVDLGEITPSFVENMICEFGVQSIEDMDSEILAEFARHFWNKGFNARKI